MITQNLVMRRIAKASLGGQRGVHRTGQQM